MSTDVVIQVTAEFEEAYRLWESGESASPSSSDLVDIAAKVMDTELDHATRHDLADALFDFQGRSGTVRESAIFVTGVIGWVTR